MTGRGLLSAVCVSVALLAVGTGEPQRRAEAAAPGAAGRAKPSARTPQAIHKALDAYLDRRWLPPAEAKKATDELLEKIHAANLSHKDIEELLRAGRSRYGPANHKGKLVLFRKLRCEHVDYTTAFFVYVPRPYSPAKAWPLLLVGHGGNSAMSANYAKAAALGGLRPWLPVVAKHGFVLAAPLSERGWGSIGNSILLSVVSRLQRLLHIDPDRIYVTGHSMGGHLSWRSGIFLGDRWGAVSPMSGGYDYVENKQVYPLCNVPGYATYGRREPYHIRKFNNKIRAWMAEHDYDWTFAEKPAGHQIYSDELPKVARFFLAHPRNLYRRRVYGVGGKTVVYNQTWKNRKWPKHTWNPNRPIPRSTFHWIRLCALPDDTPKEKATQRVLAESLGQNRFKLLSQNVRRLRIYLHPRMVDFAKPVEVTANGGTAFKRKVTPSMRTMLELVREFDDRGRIFHAVIELEISTDAEVPAPKGRL